MGSTEELERWGGGRCQEEEIGDHLC